MFECSSKILLRLDLTEQAGPEYAQFEKLQ